MKKILSVLALAFLAACSSGPSDGDVQKIVNQGMSQADAAFAPLGVQFSDLFDVETKILSKADKGGGQWLVQTEASASFKKSLSDFPQEKQLLLAASFGKFEKGKKLSAQTDQFTMIKGDKGWIATR